MATTTPTLKEITQQALNAEAAGLGQLKTLIDTFYDGLTQLNDSLDYAPNYPSECKRMIGDLQNVLEYRRTTEIPQIIERLTPPAPEPTPAP